MATEAKVNPTAERTKAMKLREEAFALALKVKSDKTKSKSEATPRLFFGIFQNCSAYYTEASTWYQAAQDAYKAGDLRLGSLYTQRGNAAMAKGDDCMSFW